MIQPTTTKLQFLIRQISTSNELFIELLTPHLLDLSLSPYLSTADGL